MIGDIVGRRYAKALFRLAQKEHSIDLVEESLDFLARMMEENKQFRYFMLTPRIDKAQKNLLLRKMFGASVPELMYSFLAIAIEKRRQMFLGKIKENFDVLYNLSIGRLLVTVESMRQLTSDEEQNLIAGLKDRTKKEIVLSKMINPSLVGGLLIRVGHMIIDSSIKTKLHKMQTMMLRTT